MIFFRQSLVDSMILGYDFLIKIKIFFIFYSFLTENTAILQYLHNLIHTVFKYFINQFLYD